MTERRISSLTTVSQARAILAGEPLVFHCNHYDCWLQHTLRLDPSLGMDAVIRAAAESVASAMLTAGARELGLTEPGAILRLAEDWFAQLGFGLLDLSGVGAGAAGSGPRSATAGRC